MNCENRNSLAERYILDDLHGASQTGARLNGNPEPPWDFKRRQKRRSKGDNGQGS